MSDIGPLLQDLGVLYAVFASPAGDNWREYGDRRHLPYDGLVNQYFPDPEGIRRLDEYLQGQTLPKTIIQGDLVCAILRPNEKLIVGAFFCGSGDTLTKMRRGRELANMISGALAV